MQRPTRPTLAARHSRRKVARAAAWIWTAGIFIACLWPGKELPHSNIPFIDKWTHFVLFGVFSVLWLWAWPARKASLHLGGHSEVGRLVLDLPEVGLGVAAHCHTSFVSVSRRYPEPARTYQPRGVGRAGVGWYSQPASWRVRALSLARGGV